MEASFVLFSLRDKLTQVFLSLVTFYYIPCNSKKYTVLNFIKGYFKHKQN